ncbi:MAG TPA: hypothetical protein VGK47_05390 [Nitrososphaeraceae archaeon]
MENAQMVNTDKNREADILELCRQVLEVNSVFYDDPNGPYSSTCPFCGSVENGDYKKTHYSMSEITHSNDCAYIIAKDLSTGLL